MKTTMKIILLLLLPLMGAAQIIPKYQQTPTVTCGTWVEYQTFFRIGENGCWWAFVLSYEGTEYSVLHSPSGVVRDNLCLLREDRLTKTLAYGLLKKQYGW